MQAVRQCPGFALRLPILFAPLREMYLPYVDISRKGAKTDLRRKENQLEALPVVSFLI
jgi:hypothetical protein